MCTGFSLVGGDENVLKLDCGDDYFLNILKPIKLYSLKG